MTLDCSPASSTLDIQDPSWQIKLLYDSECPLCMREVRFLRKRDRGRGIVKFVDIAALDYEPSSHGDVSYEDAMGRIHGILPDGTILLNIQVFRYIYERLDMGWVYAITRIQFFENLLNAIYSIWAKWRLALTGRPPIEVITAERKMKAAQYSRCRLHED